MAHDTKESIHPRLQCLRLKRNSQVVQLPTGMQHTRQESHTLTNDVELTGVAALPVAKGVHTLSCTSYEGEGHDAQTTSQQILPHWEAMLLQGLGTNQHSC